MDEDRNEVIARALVGTWIAGLARDAKTAISRHDIAELQRLVREVLGGEVPFPLPIEEAPIDWPLDSAE